MDTHDVKEVEQRAKRYWYSDGIAELAGGGILILLGLYFGIQGFFGENSNISVILQVSLVILMLAGILGVRWLVNTLKVRLTYPRTGYVEYRVKVSESRNLRLIIVASALALSAVSIVLVDSIRELDSMVLVTGFLVGGIFIALRGRSSGMKRFYWMGGMAILMGLGLSISQLEQAYTLALFYGLLGLIILTSGAVVLMRYLSENPMPSEPENGR